MNEGRCEMQNKIRIGVCGYGNLGRGVESEIGKFPDMELAAVFTRRSPAGSLKIDSDAPVVSAGDAPEWKNKIDVMILCGGSAHDLPSQGPAFAKDFNTVDSFDTHANIPEYLNSMDDAARSGKNVAVISAGWDPGIFSLMRLYMGAFLPEGETYSFWGKGVSQGHSGAIRGLEGVAGAVQYSIPNEAAIESIRKGERPKLSVREKHKRLCYVAIEEGADRDKIESKIKNMPNYFAEYDTTVNFVSLEELQRNHAALPHGGNVLRSAVSGAQNNQLLEFSLRLDSNPEMTSSVLLAFARAAHRLSQRGESGARTVFDIPPALLSFAPAADAVRDLM